MATRRTRVVLSIPWDDETSDHPANWGYDVLLDTVVDDQGLGVILIGFQEPEEEDSDYLIKPRGDL